MISPQTFAPEKDEIRSALSALRDSQDFQNQVNGIRKGCFCRDPQNPDYQKRLHYTKILRRYVYNPALLNAILMDQDLKQLFFRTFGYAGQMKFTIYPNAWLRDLPLLEFGENVYLADGIVLGTNQVSADQKCVHVDTIKIGTESTINQQVSIGYGTHIGVQCLLGFGTVVGMKTKIGNKTVCEAKANIGHRVKIGRDVRIGQMCFLGNFSIIEDGVRLAPVTVIPPFSLVTKDGRINSIKGKGKLEAAGAAFI